MPATDPSGEVARLLEIAFQQRDLPAAENDPAVRYACDLVAHLLGLASTEASSAAAIQARLREWGGAVALAAALRAVTESNPDATARLGQAAEHLRAVAYPAGQGGVTGTAGGSVGTAMMVPGGQVGVIPAPTAPAGGSARWQIGPFNLGGGNLVAIVIAATLLLGGGAVAAAMVVDAMADSPAQAAEAAVRSTSRAEALHYICAEKKLLIVAKLFGVSDPPEIPDLAVTATTVRQTSDSATVRVDVEGIDPDDPEEGKQKFTVYLDMVHEEDGWKVCGVASGP